MATVQFEYAAWIDEPDDEGVRRVEIWVDGKMERRVELGPTMGLELKHDAAVRAEGKVTIGSRSWGARLLEFLGL